MSDKKVVMIVDDSRVSRMMIKAIVVDAKPDWSVVEAAHGQEALDLVASTPHLDLIILDYNMPGMDGLTLGTELKSHYPNTKSFLLTANIQESTQKKAADAGIEFVKKPITEDKIVNILSSVEC
jgi:CheY-like chemotaxis protein